MIYNLNKNWFIFFALVVLFLSGGQPLLAYEPPVHAALTQEAVFFYNAIFPKKSIKSLELEDLMAGAKDEDSFPRMLNHFYDSTSELGLNYGGKNWQASKEWANDADNQGSFLYNPRVIFNAITKLFGKEVAVATDYTWNRAIDDYISGERSRAFEGLGHVLHLIEDLTVPAHVRNDPHPPLSSLDRVDGSGPDFYEVYTKDFIPKVIDVVNRLQKSDKELIVLDNLNIYFDELASYTNKHFYSQDTIGQKYYVSPLMDLVNTKKRDGFSFYFGTDEEGQYILAEKGESGAFLSQKSVSINNDLVKKEYWERLSQKAVQYGAGVIDLFFKEVVREQERLSAAEQNSAQALAGFVKVIEPEIQIDEVLIPEELKPLETTLPKESSSLDMIELTRQVEEAQKMVDDLARKIEIARSVEAQVLGENVEVIEGVGVETEWVPSIQFGRIIIGGGGVSSAPGIMVEEEEEAQVEEEKEAQIEEEEAETSSLEEEQVSEEAANLEEEVIETVDVDENSPNQITTLSISNVGTSTLTLSWQSVGDDADLGTAEKYDIRFSLEEITVENWEYSSQILNVPAPLAPYSQESFLVDGLKQDTEYYFAILAEDEEGNKGEMSNVTSWRTLFEPEKILISEVFMDMKGADTMEFIEFYNPSESSVDLSSWSIQYASALAKEFSNIKKKNFEEGSIIEPKSFYLVGLGNFESEVVVDMTWSQSLNNSGATIWLVAEQNTLENDYNPLIVDRLDYGAGEGVLINSVGAVVLPGVDKSLERRPEINGACADFDKDTEFDGNGCDTDSSEDFVVNDLPKPQSSLNFSEPRQKPTQLNLIGEYNEEEVVINLSWDDSKDWRGEAEDITYALYDADKKEEFFLTGDKNEKAKKILEINRSYAFEIQAFDEEGLGSEIESLVIDVPSYLDSFSWYFDEASSTIDKPVYRVALNWSDYPFIPVQIKHPALGKVDGWRLVVFAYNNEPTQFPSMGEWGESYLWATGFNLPALFWVNYKDCSSTMVRVSGVIFPDKLKQCSYLLTPPKVRAINMSYLGDDEIILKVDPRTFDDVQPKKGDYITLSYYVYDPSANFNSNQRLVAIDRTKYYLQIPIVKNSAPQLD